MGTPFDAFIEKNAEAEKIKQEEMVKNKRTVKVWDIFDPRTDWAIAEISSKRMEICNACPSLLKFTKQCKECSCFMTVKTKIQVASCPLGKW